MNMNSLNSAMPALAATKDLKALKKATQEFEAVFAKKLLGEMRKGVKETSFGDTLGKDMYEDMMDDELSKTMAKQGVLGIGKILYHDFAPKIVAMKQMAHERATKHSAAPLNGSRARLNDSRAPLKGSTSTAFLNTQDSKLSTND